MDEIKKLLGLRIKEIRLNKKLTQEELADLVGTEQKNISNIECGYNFPSKYLNKIAQALDVSLPVLFDFEHLERDLDYKRNFIKLNIDKITDEETDIIYRFLKSMI